MEGTPGMPNIHPDNIAGIHIDKENQQIHYFTKDVLINQLQRECPAVCDSFDNLFENELKEFSQRLSLIYPLISIGIRKAANDKKELFETCGILHLNAMNTLIASIQTLRSGFRLQSGMLIRNSVETFATIFHLLANPNDLEKFKEGKLKSTYAISSANRMLPIFGKIFGDLSNRLMHLNYGIHGEFYSLGEYRDRENERPALVTLGITGVAFWIAHVTAEIIFIDLVEHPIYWKEVGDNEGKFTFLAPRAELDWIEKILSE